MEVEIASIQITVSRDFQRKKSSVLVVITKDITKKEILIEGLCEALLSYPELKELFNLAARKANDIRKLDSN